MRPDRDSEWSSLLRAANAGDSLSYQRFLRELAPVLRAFVRRLLARTNSAGAEAEDIVQDILLAIHLKRQTWIETAPVTPWVFTIARHKTIDALRQGLAAAPKNPEMLGLMAESWLRQGAAETDEKAALASFEEVSESQS